jgi:type I restriction enzyme S subunit
VNTSVECITASVPVVPLTEAVEINPKPERSGLSDDLEVSFVPMAAVEAATGRIDASALRKYGDVKKGYTSFRDGDVLFAKITPCMENGKMAVARGLHNGVGCGSTEFHVLRPRLGVDPNYVYHFVSSAKYRAEAAHYMTGAVGQRRVPASFLKQSQLPLPDLGKQRRIIEEIEKQFSRLDEAVANLKRVKANLKRYKAAVLKAAVEGRLVPTEAELACREGRGYEAGVRLLQRILETRRRQWNYRGKYKEPAPVDTSKLPHLPEGWVWTTFGQVTERVTKGSSPNWQGFDYCDEGIPFVRSQNVGWGQPDLSNLAFLPPSFNEVEKKAVLQDGDLLLNIVGASIGRAALAPKTVVGGNVNQAVAVIRLLSDDILNYYAMSYLLSAGAQRRIHLEKVDVARANFSLEDIKAMPLPLPPLAEQHRIVAEVGRCFSIIDALEGVVVASLGRAARLRDVVLRSSFEPLGRR